MSNFVQKAIEYGANNITQEDEGIAYCINYGEPLKSQAIGRLYEKYYSIVREYAENRFKELSATGKDMIADATFDQIQDYVKSEVVVAKNGTLGTFLTLICEWCAGKVLRTEKRRRNLLSKNFQELWCVQRDESENYKPNTISEQDVEELIFAVRRELDPQLCPHTGFILEAISAVYIGSNGLQVNGLDRSPSVSSIQTYLGKRDINLSAEEINRCLQVLRSRAKTVLKENGWEIEPHISKYVK